MTAADQCHRLKRTRQCAKCPWKKGTNPYDIPHGYSEEQHVLLAKTIGDPGLLDLTDAPARAMACHEHPQGAEVFCIGWLHHQLGVGNNVTLRVAMSDCENLNQIQVDGPQHERFEDTLPGLRFEMQGKNGRYSIFDRKMGRYVQQNEVDGYSRLRQRNKMKIAGNYEWNTLGKKTAETKARRLNFWHQKQIAKRMRELTQSATQE